MLFRSRHCHGGSDFKRKREGEKEKAETEEKETFPFFGKKEEGEVKNVIYYAIILRFFVPAT